MNWLETHSQPTPQGAPLDVSGTSDWDTGGLMVDDVLKNFQPKVPFSIDTDDFIIQTASTTEDIKLALKLRHQVFLEEGLGKRHSTGLEFDAYDQLADHLMIIEKATGSAIGTYRLIHSDFSDRFYSQGEFHLDRFLKIEGSKLELGRACTHEDHRTGRTMDLLWQGLSQYIVLSKTRFLFGCSSVDSIDPNLVFSVLQSLNSRDSVSFDLAIMPTDAYTYPEAASHFKTATVNKAILRTLPPLLRSYLHAGAKVHGFPALDVDFACSDLLTILDLKDLNSKFQDRYLPNYQG